MSDAFALGGSTLGAFSATALRVRASWSRLSWRHFAIALGAGGALGMVQGLGHVITQEGVWWMHLVISMAPPLALALMLLLGLAIAVDVEVSRGPRWMPFAIAAVVAAFAAALFDWTMMYVLTRMNDEPWQFRPIAVAHYAWTWGPYFFTLAGFAAFGARQAIDARRRADLLRHVQLDRVRVAREAYESRLVALQARVEPRFLFETLAAIETLYEEDESAGARVLDDLIVYLRAALPTSEEVSSTLADELALVRAWLDIMRIRSRDQLWFALPDDMPGTNVRMPPMLLLPLVQHAADAAPGDRAVFVSTQADQDRLRVTVTAEAAAFASQEEPGPIASVRQRLAGLYAENASLRFGAVLHGRSQATLEIPHEQTDSRPR